ncbi:MAG TPA: DUF5678 domain-containing protein [Candidatus Hodarchaeales archaeon]|nr:DUF5678 domain-containing protein [Candidatus Hodarchaeales archaeon]
MALKEFREDKQYLDADYERLKTEHANEFVVIHSKQVVASGANLETVLSEAREKIGDNLKHSVVEYLGTRKVEMVV